MLRTPWPWTGDLEEKRETRQDEAPHDCHWEEEDRARRDVVEEHERGPPREKLTLENAPADEGDLAKKSSSVPRYGNKPAPLI